MFGHVPERAQVQRTWEEASPEKRSGQWWRILGRAESLDLLKDAQYEAEGQESSKVVHDPVQRHDDTP